MAPWRGPRHRSWASDTIISTVAAVVVIGIYIGWEVVGEAPQGLITLVGLAGGWIFGAVSGDKRKRDADVERTAIRAEEKADRLAHVAESEHPDTTHAAGLPSDAPSPPRPPVGDRDV